jgi:hypothetical protein
MKKQSILMPAIALALFISPIARAEDKKAEHFEEQKKQTLANFDARIAALNEAKSCVSGAANGEAIKACHEKLKAAHEALAEHAIDSRIEALQKRKAEMKAKSGH